jgi:hypothetical protein
MNASSNPRQRLLSLLEELPELLGHRWESPLQTHQFEHQPRLSIDFDLAGERIRLLHALAPDERHLLLLECRVARMPRRGPAHTQTLITVLDQNFRMSSKRSCAYAINPALGELIFMIPCALLETSAESLADLVRSSVTSVAAVRVALPQEETA